MTLDNLVVGFQKLMSGGTPKIININRQGDLAVQLGGASYQELVERECVFSSHNAAAQAVSVALATTYTGLVLSNPVGSKYKLVLLGCNFALSVAPAAIASLHLLSGFSATADVTHTTPAIVRSNIIGNAVDSIAKVDSAATISAPVYHLPLGSGFTAAALPSHTPSWIDLKGSIVIKPGGFVAIGALTAVTGFGGFVWAEIPE